MEYLRLLNCQSGILCVKNRCITIRKLCTFKCVNFHIYAGILLCKYIKSIYINIAIYQNDFFLCFLYDRCDQGKCIIYLAIKEYFLLRFCMILNLLERLIKSFIR